MKTTIEVKMLTADSICAICAKFLPANTQACQINSTTVICNTCRPAYEAAIEAAPRNNAKHVAKKLYHENVKSGTRTINDLPDLYWDLLGQCAYEEHSSKRDITIKAIWRYYITKRHEEEEKMEAERKEKERKKGKRNERRDVQRPKSAR